MMKNGLQLILSQRLAMTPQLQKSIQLLQISTLELCQEIQQAVESNPLLEIKEEFKEIDVEEPSHKNEKAVNELMQSQIITDDFSSIGMYNEPLKVAKKNTSQSNHEHFTFQGETTHSLQDDLMWQLNLANFDANELMIANLIIQSINDKGYQSCDLNELIEDNNPFSYQYFENTLKKIQQFEPVGVGARTLQECLIIQVNSIKNQTASHHHAKKIIEQHLDLLAKKEFKSLAKSLQINEQALKKAVDIIYQLNPVPGNKINKTNTQYIIPDVIVKKRDDKWIVIINGEALPKLTINEYYASMKKTDNKEDRKYIQKSLQEAQFLIKSIANRNDTLMRVSQFIVAYQQKFFEEGELHIKPMILSDVANELGIHESTVSRITTAKYLQCARGVFELKYFFSNQIDAAGGELASSASIKALIKKLISEESPQKPLSDSQIVKLLKAQNINIARRTIAKYRESLMIPPSNLRKQL